MANLGDITQFRVSKQDTPTSSAMPEKRKMKAFRLNREAVRQLAMLRAEQERTEQSLLTEAVNLLFRKYGKDPIA